MGVRLFPAFAVDAVDIIAVNTFRETQMLVLLTRMLLWASIGVLLWYILTRMIPRQYLSWFGGFILIALLVLTFVESDNDTVRIIWQILSFPLSPLGLSVVLIGGALSEGLKKVKPGPVAAALGILVFSSIPLVAQSLVVDAETRVSEVFEQQAALCGEVCRIEDVPGANLGEAGAIAVFGDSRDADISIDGPETTSNVAVNTLLAPRLIYAADVYNRSGAAPLVIVTAGSGDEDSQQRRNIRSILNSNGVPDRDIQIESTDLNIRRTAERVEEILEEGQIIAPPGERTENERRIVVVAPAILMSRAALTFERMGLEVIARPTDFYSARFNRSNDLLEQLPQVLPNVDALQLTTRYWNELLTSMYYFLRGWLPNFNFGWDSSIEI
ncbi:MAG: ElyC/SanA/YdcF family protein [Cyanobacteria bacterium J06626_6]